MQGPSPSRPAPLRPWRPAAFCAAALGLALLLGPASARVPPAETADQAIDDAVAFFDTVALTRRNADGIAEAGAVRRWRGSVAVTLEGVAVPGFREVVAASLARLSDWTGLAFRLVDRPGSADRIAIRIRPGRPAAGKLGTGDAVCLTSAESEAGRLHRAVIDIGERYLDCLDHELMHALGFDNHWHGDGVAQPIASVLAPRRSPDRRSGFSSWDILAIRMLYSAELPPGLARAEALARARAILTEQSVIPAAGD